MLTPYTLDFSARISVILLPWAGLPWMLALTIRALRAGDKRGAWKYAAIFAIVVQVIGGVNATALVFAGIAPVLWIVYAVLIGEVDWRRALGVTARIGFLTVVTSLWWLAGLWAQSGYGLNILKFTETLQVVSLSSMPSEVLRGLGYWFFYGIDRIGHWTEASVPYTQNLGLLFVSFAIPVLAVLAAVCVRWRHRAYFVVLVIVGVVVAVGANPYDDPSIARWPVQVVRGVIELRARAAQHEPRGPAGRARPGRPARRRGQRGGGRLAGARSPGGAVHRCGRWCWRAWSSCSRW